MIVLRADAGPGVGFGHLMRCIALADGIRARGSDAVVLMTENAISDVELGRLRRAVPVDRLDVAASSADDANVTAGIARRVNASAVITDVCTQPALARRAELDDFHRRLREQVRFLVVFAAGDHLDPIADLVVNPYFLDAERRRQSGAEPGRVLWGPDYFVFRPEFTAAADVPRPIPARVRKILVTVGGSDPAGLTLRIVDALVAVVDDDVEVRVVIGPGFPPTYLQRIQTRVNELGSRWTAIGPPEHIASLFLWSDLAITGDGLTKYETAVTGTPSIIVARPDSDMNLNEQFARAGSTICVGAGAAADWAKLPTEIQRLLDDRETRESMSRKGRALTDGRGVERVLDRLPLVSRE